MTSDGDRWAALVDGWVDDGVITEAQRADVLVRLRSLPPPRDGVFGEAAVMGLVTAGVLLITGSFIVALALMEVPEEPASLAVTLVGLLQLAIGAGARFGVHRAVGHGLGAAGVVVALAGLLGLGLTWPEVEPVALVGGLLVFVAVSAAAVADRARGLAGAAGFGVVGPLLAQLDGPASHSLLYVLPLAFVLVVCTAVVAAERLELPVQPAVLEVQLPFAAVVAGTAVVLRRPLFVTGPNAHEWEMALALGLFGGAAMLAGWAASSRFALVTGLGVLLVAQLPVLWVFGSAIVGIAVLGLEGMALIGAAVLAIVVRARQGQRAAGAG